MRVIKVLMLVPNLRVSNGVASFAMNYYRHLDHSRIKMDFLAYKKIDSPYTAEILHNGDSIYYVSSVKHVVRHIKGCRTILNNNYDIIHDNSLLITYPMMFMSMQRVPYRILHSHSTKLGENDRRERRNRLFIPFLKQTANRYAACSENAGKVLFGNKLFEVIPDVIETSRFRFDATIRHTVREREDCKHKYVVGTVGRVTEAKNPFFAVDVMERILAQFANVEYWWIGSGALDNELRDYIAKKGLQEKIRLFGSREDVNELYQAMDLFFMPSEFEGFGMACVEAQTSGLYCVVSDAISKEVDITGNVAFVPLNDGIAQWCEVVKCCMKKKNDRESVYTIAALSNCSASSAGERLTDYYMRILSETV